jgi:outer membrane biosynthesis protein TonB
MYQRVLSWICACAAAGAIASPAAAQSSERQGLTGDCARHGAAPDLATVVASPDTLSRLVSPRQRTPKFVLRDGYRGHVLVAFVVDTSGRPERNTTAIVESTDPALTAWACQIAPSLRFTASWADGHRVRSQVAIPFDFAANVIDRRDEPPLVLPKRRPPSAI